MLFMLPLFHVLFKDASIVHFHSTCPRSFANYDPARPQLLIGIDVGGFVEELVEI
jgi:hypothetical protein